MRTPIKKSRLLKSTCKGTQIPWCTIAAPYQVGVYIDLWPQKYRPKYIGLDLDLLGSSASNSLMACLLAVLFSQLEKLVPCAALPARHSFHDLCHRSLNLKMKHSYYWWEAWLVYACPRIPNPQVFLVIFWGAKIPTRTWPWSSLLCHWLIRYSILIFSVSLNGNQASSYNTKRFVDMIRLYLPQISGENIKVNNRLQSSLLRM